MKLLLTRHHLVMLQSEALQMTYCIRLTISHVLWVRHTARCLVFSQQGKKALGIPIIHTSASVYSLVSGDAEQVSCGEIVGIKWVG